MDETFHSSSLVIPYLDTRSTSVNPLRTKDLDIMSFNLKLEFCAWQLKIPVSDIF